MFKISEFSKLSQVPAKTLRYYDQLDLLKPAYTDPESGYRYYASDQLIRLHRILAFKELGFTLEQIKQMLRENISTAEVRGMLRLKQAEARQLIQAEMERLRRIEARIEQIERGENVSALREVVVKQVEPILAVTLETTASRSDIPELFEELDNHARRYGIVPAAPHIVVWHACPECETNIHLEVAVPFHGEMPSSGPFQVKLLPAVTAASVTHVSRPDTDSPVSLDLGVWIERNGYAIQPDVPSREVYVSHIEGRAGHFVTESLMPIVR